MWKFSLSVLYFLAAPDSNKDWKRTGGVWLVSRLQHDYHSGAGRRSAIGPGHYFRKSLGRGEQRYPPRLSMELYAGRASLQLDRHHRFDRETTADHRPKQQRADVDVQCRWNRSVPTIAASAILLQFRPHRRCNRPGPETGSRGWLGAGADPQFVERPTRPSLCGNLRGPRPCGGHEPSGRLRS